jgi:DNA primase
MSLLQNKRYARSQPQQESEPQPNTVVDVLKAEETNLINAILDIEEAKSHEQHLRNRLNVVQNSLSAFRALEAAPETPQEQQAPPPPVVKNVRKAATKKSVTPTQRSIAPEPTVGDTENIELVHDDFATFPE